VTRPGRFPPTRQVQQRMLERVAACQASAALRNKRWTRQFARGCRRRPTVIDDLRARSGANASRPFRTAPRS
jgi:hypothetical protein